MTTCQVYAGLPTSSAISISSLCRKKKKRANERLQQTQVISLKSTPAETHPERPSQTLPASTLGSRQTPLHCVPHIVTFLPRWLLSWDVPLQLLSLIPSFPATGGSCGPSREQVMQASTEKHNEPFSSHCFCRLTSLHYPLLFGTSEHLVLFCKQYFSEN